MQDSITHEALEALAREYRLTMDKDVLHSWAGDAARALDDIADKLRTGQLVPAQPSVKPTERQSETLHKALIASFSEFVEPIALTQPSGDVVEAVALAIDGENTQGVTLPSTMHIDWVRDMRMAQATAAITTYEAVSGVAKMREALKAVNDAETPSSWEAAVDGLIEAARAALGEKP